METKVINIDGRDWFVPETNHEGQFYNSNYEISHLKVYDYHRCPIVAEETVLDVGANIGLFSVYCLEKGAKQVIAIEPGYVCDSLKLNLEKYEERATCLNIGVWSHNTTLEFVDIPVWSVQGCIQGQMKEYDANHSFREVECNSIDRIVNRLNIDKLDFIKFDIEGSELEALRGAQYTIKTFKPKIALCLYHNKTDFDVLPKIIFDFVWSYQYTQLSYREIGIDVGYFY